MDYGYLGSKGLILKAWTNLDFWAFRGFLGVWIDYGFGLEGRLSGRVGIWTEMLSWIKFKCKKSLWTRKYANMAFAKWCVWA